MLRTSFSAAERSFVELGVAQNVRNDGRERLDYRPLSIDSGVLPQTYGSSRVTIGKGIVGGNGGTDVIAAIKAEVGMVPPLG